MGFRRPESLRDCCGCCLAGRSTAASCDGAELNAGTSPEVTKLKGAPFFPRKVARAATSLARISPEIRG